VSDGAPGAGGRASAYLERLSELVRGIRVTDRDGTEHGLDAGARLVIDMILSVRSAGSKAMVVGNGGSAAIAGHLQADLCNAVGVRTLTFTAAEMVTALSNDHGYGCVFERPIQLWAEPNDLLVAISSSGQSDNILRAVRAARACDCRVITLSGFQAHNPLRQSGDLNFYVASDAYGFVELAHAAVVHFLADAALTLQLQEPEIARVV
jgi:D-sedoheptulose 7-phosphate isomerase